MVRERRREKERINQEEHRNSDAERHRPQRRVRPHRLRLRRLQHARPIACPVACPIACHVSDPGFQNLPNRPLGLLMTTARYSANTMTVL